MRSAMLASSSSTATNVPDDEATTSLLKSLASGSSTWSRFDLDGRRPNLDRAASACRESRDASQSARKSLAEVTKGFKKNVKSTETIASGQSSGPLTESVATLAGSCRSIVKAYQEEIDNLTRRCKASDSAFLNLYQILYECPDPAPLLRLAGEDVASKGSQLNHLLKGMEEMNGEIGAMEEECTKLRLDNQSLTKDLDEQRKKNERNSETSSNTGIGKAEKEELIQLRREVAEYEVEFRGLKNQDITIRKLEAKIADMQLSQDEQLKIELKKAQEDLAETEGRRAAEALEREAAMERKLQGVELELRAERAGRAATQAHLLEADEGAGEREAAWEAQRQILVDDSERLREALHEASRERDTLRLRVEALLGREERSSGMLSPGGNSSVMSPPSSGLIGFSEFLAERKAFEAEVTELTLTARSLREELRTKDEAMSEERRTMQSTVEDLRLEKIELSQALEELKSELQTAPSKSSIESMKRELRILKRLEYNAVDVDAEKDPEMTTAATDGGEDDLESVLVAKMRRIEDELVRERRANAERSNECNELRKKLTAADNARTEAENLVASLEVDLQKAIVAPSAAASPAVVKETMSLQTVSDPSTLQRILDPSAPALATTTSTSGKDGTAAPAISTTAAEKANDDHSVATIVMAQRDRLRARCDALEAERDSFKRELQVQVSSAESLKADNTKLYEKVRYLQNFGSKNDARGAINRSRGNGTAVPDRDLDLEALEQRYEASVDPFRQFSRAERLRKLNEMSSLERFVFVVAKIVLGSKEMRTALFFYVLTMHLLVFFTTYHWSHEKGCHNLHMHDSLAHMHGGVPAENQPH